MWQRPSGSFDATGSPPNGWKTAWEAQALPVAPVQLELWQTDEANRKAFGIELAKKPLNPFQAALIIFGDDTNKAVWASVHWKNDPVVIASRDIYQQTVDVAEKTLDKEAFSVKLLQLADEKSPDGRFYLNDAQDRIKALELYAKVRGFIGKSDFDNSINNITNNVMELIVVKSPEKQEHKVIEQAPIDDFVNTDLGVELKLVV